MQRAGTDGTRVWLNGVLMLAASCRQGWLLGFTGNAVIHPLQVGAANAAFGADTAT